MDGCKRDEALFQSGLTRIAFYGKLASRAGASRTPAARSSEMRSQGRRTRTSVQVSK